MTAQLNADQRNVAEFLKDPKLYGGAERVEVIETHISMVFMAADKALKMKKAVKLEYLDYSTLEQRRLSCLTELQSNSRTAPEIYQGVVAVCRDNDGQLSLDGDGEVVEWLVEMKRFDDESRLDVLLSHTSVPRHLIVDLADHVAAFHQEAETSDKYGGAEGIALIRDNIAKCLAETKEMFPAGLADAWDKNSRTQLERVATHLDQRRSAGAVRHCHGDMHLANICVVDGNPLLFDGIEFNEAYAWIDIIYDLAFVIMDLGVRGHGRFANILMNRYFDATGEILERPHTLSVLPSCLSLRAAVRAHVCAAQHVMTNEEAGRRLADDAVTYLEQACRYLAAREPRLIAVGGLSGSGKSRMARELAPHIGLMPGARVVRTDAVRKRISGASQEQRLGPEGYTPDMHTKTYDAFYEEARTALAQGWTVVLDGVFPVPGQRARAEALALEAGVPFHGLWIEASEDVRVSRVLSRQRNISDVTEEIAREQSGYDLGDITWTRIDSSGPKEETLRQGLQVIGKI